MSGFRQSFGKLSRNLNWYPKHMNTGLKQMAAKLRSVDCIIELHDSRIPLSGRNPTFADSMVGDKPHMLILNKVDLITRDDMRRIAELNEKSGMKHVIFTNCKNDQDSGIKKIVPLMKTLIATSDRYHRAEMQEYHAMIIGIPNVGKSSLINMLRSKHLKKGRALKVGPSAGVTKCVHEKVRICDTPHIFLFDTPGILTPRIEGTEGGVKLAVCGNLQDHGVGEMVIADYILYKLNKLGNTKYLKFMGLQEPSDCITTVLTNGCLHLNLINKVRAVNCSAEVHNKPNFDLMAKMFIEKFRSGEFGKIVLDDLNEEAMADFRNVQLLPNETFVTS